jgi:hypothetical protein
MQSLNFFSENRSFNSNESLYDSIFAIDNLTLDYKQLETFLKIGYVPSNLTLFNGVKLVNPNSQEKSLASIFSDLPEYKHDYKTLKNILMKSIAENYKENRCNVVPLSGGMDSRIILAALCELTEAKNIHTYTFGVPGAYDYEIPNRIARKLGTNHTNFSAKDTNYTVDGLVRAAVASDGNTEVFHPLVLNRVADHYSCNTTYWSGYAGDLVGGAFGNRLVGDDAKQQLINYEKRGIHFLDNVTDDKELYPYIGLGTKMSGYVSSSEACFWENHLERYTGHHIFRNDMDIVAPLIGMRFLKFFLTLPKDQRANKTFFNQAFSNLFPKIFSIPTKDYGYKYSKSIFLEPLHKARFYLSAIGWRLAPNKISHPNAAYIDMRLVINERLDVRGCIDMLFEDLAQRNIIDNDRMFHFLNEHRSMRKDYTKDIINLASLEVILKAANL